LWLTFKLISIMAKVKLSALVSGMSGKLNGSVFARNRGGLYLRTKVTPLNPQTADQVAARARLAGWSQGWRSLTQAVRDSWNNAVGNFQTTDIFGDIKTPSGNTLYTKLNTNIQLAGGVAITNPPAPIGATAMEGVDVTAAQTLNAFSVNVAPDPIPADHTLIVEATAPMSAGIHNANSDFRIIGTQAAAAIPPFDMSTEYVAKFGNLVAGQKVFVRTKMIRISTGEVGQQLVASTIIGA
jgi:hypothetical protein